MSESIDMETERETDEDRGRKRGREEAEGRDPAVFALERIISSSGGVTDRKHITALLAALAEERREQMRRVFLHAVERSSHEVKEQLVTSPHPEPGGPLQCGILTIDAWANESQQTPDTAVDFLTVVIRCLSSLPMTLECLKRTKVGKTIGALRKHPHLGLAGAAKDLVEKWRVLAGPMAGPGGGGQGPEVATKKPPASKAPAIGDPSSNPNAAIRTFILP